MRDYDPCLACLAGVDASASSSDLRGGGKNKAELLFDADDDDDDVNSRIMVGSGTGVLESDMFTIGDDEDEVEVDGKDGNELGLGRDTKKDGIFEPPPYSEKDQAIVAHEKPDDVAANPHKIQTQSPEEENPTSSSSSDPTKYYIQPKDTLSGISLKLGIDVCAISQVLVFSPRVFDLTDSHLPWFRDVV